MARRAETPIRKLPVTSFNVAAAGLKRRAGRVGPALVIAGNDDPAAAVFEHDLGAAEHMAGGHQGDPNLADRQALPISERLQNAARRLAMARPHDRDRGRGREHPPVAGTSMVAMPVRDDGARHRRSGSMKKPPGSQ